MTSFFLILTNGEVMGLKHNNITNISYEMAKVIPKEYVEFDNLLLKRVSQIGK